MASKPSQQLVPICPKCGSTAVSLNDENKLMGAYGTPAQYTCESCGFTTHIFPEVPRSEVKAVQKEEFNLEENNSKDFEKSVTNKKATKPIVTDYGHFMTRTWWLIAGALAIVMGIFIFVSAFTPVKDCSQQLINNYTFETEEVCTTSPNSSFDKNLYIGSGLFSMVLGLLAILVSLFLRRRDKKHSSP